MAQVIKVTKEIKDEILRQINNSREGIMKEYKRKNTDLELVNYLNGVQTGMELAAHLLGIKIFWNRETHKYEAA